MGYPKRSQYKYAKSRYRVLNWADYETGLQRRGALTVWLSDAALGAWQAPATGRPGGQPTYSDLAIEASQTIRMIFHLPAPPDRRVPSIAGKSPRAGAPDSRPHDSLQTPSEARTPPIEEARCRQTDPPAHR
jgi:hypothetical protein